jgi:DNA-binding YbaB/EbfC family protein
MSKAMKDLMKQAQRMQAQMQQAQGELAAQEFEGVSGHGLVSVRMNGRMEITGITLKPEAVDPKDVELLEDLIMAAVRNASEKASQAGSERLSGLTGGMKIPGLL